MWSHFLSHFCFLNTLLVGVVSGFEGFDDEHWRVLIACVHRFLSADEDAEPVTMVSAGDDLNAAEAEGLAILNPLTPPEVAT